MCYAKPGPRCSPHSLAKFEAATEKARRTGALPDRAAALMAEDVYDTTPGGQKRLKAKIAHPGTREGDVPGLQARLASAVQRRKDQAAAYKAITGEQARADKPLSGDQDDLPAAVPRSGTVVHPAQPGKPQTCAYTEKWTDRTGAVHASTQTLTRVDPANGVYLGSVDTVRVEADRPLTPEEGKRLAQLTGYAASASMGQGEGMSDHDQDTPSSVVLGADTTKYRGRSHVDEFPDMLRRIVNDGSPKRKTKNDTRLVEGIPGIRVTLWAKDVWLDGRHAPVRP